MMKVLILFFFVLATACAIKDQKQYYCGKMLVGILQNICRQPVQKRSSFAYSIDNRENRLNLWKKVFNINDNTTATIPEISFQMNLLFGKCNDYRKQIELNELRKMYKNQIHHKNLDPEYTNDQLMNMNNLNYDQVNSKDNYDLESSYKPIMRFRRDVVDECCKNACPYTELLKFCPE